MAQGLITHAYLEDIADAIREQYGSQATYTPAQMADAIRLIGWEMPTEHSWANASDSDIVGIIKAAHAGLIDLQQDAGWAVGDVRRITLTTNEQVDLVIPTFANYENCGCVMQFDFMNCLASKSSMGSYGDNIGRWTDSRVYKSVIPSIVNSLPSYIKDNLIPFNVRVLARAKYDHSIVVVQNNLLSLRSVDELTSTSIGQGSHIPYYEDNQTNRVKKLGINGSATDWWTRSPAWGVETSFYYIESGGSNSQNGGYSPSRGIAPFGCL